MPGPRESPAPAPPLPVRVSMSFSGPLTHQTKLCENSLKKAQVLSRRETFSVCWVKLQEDGKTKRRSLKIKITSANP